MHSKIDICNMALAYVGESPIRSFTESNRRARMCDIIFDAMRDYLLAKFDWPFARSFATLKQISAADLKDKGIVVPERECVYQLPEDCATPRDLYPYGSKQFWYIAQDRLYCLRENAQLRYTRKEVYPEHYSYTFSSLLSLGVAVRLAPTSTQDKSLTSTLYRQFRAEQAEVMESDANIGNEYREYDEDPNNDTFVSPDLADDYT